ncbi:MAG TPA: SDR family oxidoreductase [Verrucomicrobiae bacterium]|jgi:nucleoside-diphosphate-sugar epimerase
MKKILITGSTGYLGSVMTGYLQQHGHECIGYDTGFFKDCLLYEQAPAKTIARDARDLGPDDLKGIDAVVHLAGISNDPFGNLDAAKVYDPTRHYAKRIAKMCKAQGVKFIFASSCSIYGIGGADLVDENSPTLPQTPYSLNKLQVEQDLQSLADKNFSPIALRFATAFGLSPRIRFDLVTNMLAGMAFTTGKIVLNSDGTPWRPNVHIQDICKSVRYAIDSGHRDGTLLVLNVGDECNNLQVIDIARKIQARVKGCELKYLKDNPELDKEGLVRDRKVKQGVDTRTYRVAFAKIKTVFPGFQCDWPMDKGVDDLVSKFESIPLTEALFKNKNFYRLQKIENLYQNQFLSPDLRWLKTAA